MPIVLKKFRYTLYKHVIFGYNISKKISLYKERK